MHHVGILYDQFMMHGQRNIKLRKEELMKLEKVCLLEVTKRMDYADSKEDRERTNTT